MARRRLPRTKPFSDEVLVKAEDFVAGNRGDDDHDGAVADTIVAPLVNEVKRLRRLLKHEAAINERLFAACAVLPEHSKTLRECREAVRQCLEAMAKGGRTAE